MAAIGRVHNPLHGFKIELGMIPEAAARRFHWLSVVIGDQGVTTSTADGTNSIDEASTTQ